MANGLQHIHKNNFVHRDIKPENILISVSSNGQVAVFKISDFGLGKPTKENGDFSDSKCGRYQKYFTAPELLNNEGNLGRINNNNYKSDIFSLGCVFFTFLTKGEHPFYHDDDQDTHGNKIKSEIAIPYNASIGKYKGKG